MKRTFAKYMYNFENNVYKIDTTVIFIIYIKI